MSYRTAFLTTARGLTVASAIAIPTLTANADDAVQCEANINYGLEELKGGKIKFSPNLQGGEGVLTCKKGNWSVTGGYDILNTKGNGWSDWSDREIGLALANVSYSKDGTTIIVGNMGDYFPRSLFGFIPTTLWGEEPGFVTAGMFLQTGIFASQEIKVDDVKFNFSGQISRYVDAIQHDATTVTLTNTDAPSYAFSASATWQNITVGAEHIHQQAPTEFSDREINALFAIYNKDLTDGVKFSATIGHMFISEGVNDSGLTYGQTALQFDFSKTISPDLEGFSGDIAASFNCTTGDVQDEKCDNSIQGNVIYTSGPYYLRGGIGVTDHDDGKGWQRDQFIGGGVNLKF